MGLNSSDDVYPVYLVKGNSGAYLTLCLSTEHFYSTKSPTKRDLRKIRVFRNAFENVFLKYYENESNLDFKIDDFFDSVDLTKNEYSDNEERKQHRKRAKPYEIGTIFARYYDVDKLPSETRLKSDFINLVKIYEFAKKYNIYEKVESILYSDQDLYSIDTSKYDSINRKSDRFNELYYGVPGSGKSHYIKKNILQGAEEYQIERVLFHPDYTYSDFIGQILPQVRGGEVSYDFVPGPFTSILKKAYSDPEINYYLVIEEINRGNAPAIFGDVFQLLDRKEEGEDSSFPSGTSEYGINNSNIASIVYGKENKNHMVRIPSNLSIISSMNTSDQNVFTLDTAFQRRWEMKLIPNSFDAVSEDFKNTQIHNSSYTWEEFCNRINEVILKENSLNLSSEDKRLGVYFVSKNELSDPELFAEKVLKYLWDDAFKFNREKIFKNEYDSLEKLISDFKKENQDCFAVFRDGLFETRFTMQTINNPEE